MAKKHNLVTLPNFKMKFINSDFLVDEIYLQPRLTSKDKASHTYLYVEKENLTTFQLLQILADYFQIDVKEVSAAGLKDEQAVTRQIVSVRTIVLDERVKLANDFFRDEGLIVSICHMIGYGRQPVYPRRLHGNKFSITIRNVDEDVARKVEQRLNANNFFTLINYYDEQRFGLPDSIHNTHLIGQGLLVNNWQVAYREYLKSGNEPQELERVKAAFAGSQSYYEALQAIMPAKLNFFVASHNSFLWNKKLNEEIAQLGDAALVEFPYIGAISLPSRSKASVPAMLSIDVEQKNWQTGDNFPTVKQRPAVVNVSVYLLERGDDQLHGDGKQALTVAFYLPTGCYATMLVKQLLLTSK